MACSARQGYRRLCRLMLQAPMLALGQGDIGAADSQVRGASGRKPGMLLVTGVNQRIGWYVIVLTAPYRNGSCDHAMNRSRATEPGDTQGGPMRLVICDGNRLLCEALGAVLQSRDHEVLAIASSADDCVTAVTNYKPDVCLLDVRIPRPEDGLRTVGEIRSQCPGTAVLVLSDLSDRRICSQARNLGVAGLMGKDRSVNQITAALDVIIDGEAVFDQIIDGEAVCDQGLRREPPSTAVPVNLTPREAEVLRRMVAGQDTRRMASDMNVTVSTLRTYVKNVLAKLGAHSRLEAVALASREPARCCARHSADAATWRAGTPPFDVAAPRQAGIPR